MTKGISPKNRALQDRIVSVLCDAWPSTLTSSQIAERVGGTRTVWEVCTHCRTQEGRPGYSRFPATHHDGPVPQDSWEVPWNAMDMNPPLNRLAGDGVVEKIKAQALRGVLWRWAGDADVLTQTIVDLESLYASEPPC